MTLEVKQVIADLIKQLVHGDGDQLPEELPLSEAQMDELADWFEEYGESVFGTEPGMFEAVDGVFGAVYKEPYIYLHIQDPAAFAKMKLPVPDVRIRDCELLLGPPLFFMIEDGMLQIDVPRPDRDYFDEAPVDTVVVIRYE